MAVSGDLCVNIDNRLDEIERVASEIEGFLMARGTADTVIFRLNLALEELLVNTITHGLPEDQHHVIHLRLHRDADSIHVTIDDGGIAFNPFDRPDVDTTLSIEDRNIGGLGIQLVREMMSEIGYKRIGDRNHVTLKLLVQDDAPESAKGN